MKRRTLWLAVAVFVASMAADAQARAGDGALLLTGRLSGSINPASVDYVESLLERAEKQDARAVILELDTPGGLVSSARSLAQAIDESPVPVIVWVHPAGAAATSAGALIMLAAHGTAMAPGTNMGAAHPVGGEGKALEGVLGEKATADVAAFARGLAEARGRDPKLAQEMVTKSRSFSAQEAVDAGLADVFADSLPTLVSRLQGRTVRVRRAGAEVPLVLDVKDSVVLTHEMTAGQKTLHFLADPNIATLLMTAGTILLYIELSTPGVGFAGVLGVICLVIAVMAYQLLPIRSGALVLLVAGVAMGIAEIFVVSGGALAVGSVISFVLGMLWLIDPASSSGVVSASVWVPAALALSAIPAALTFFLLRSRKMEERTRQEIGGGALAGLAGYEAQVESVQDAREQGTRGSLKVRGELWDFECDERLAVGDWVKIETVSGLRLKVRHR